MARGFALEVKEPGATEMVCGIWTCCAVSDTIATILCLARTHSRNSSLVCRFRIALDSAVGLAANSNHNSKIKQHKQFCAFTEMTVS